MARAGHDEVVLLTGFPSLTARKLCEELVATGPRTLVHAVVPAASLGEARESLDLLPLEQRSRVNLVEGDASSMDFGLSGHEVRTLLPEVDRIHHLARLSAPDASRKDVERANLGGARELLEIAAACPALKCAVFHSSAHVSGDRTGLVLEGELENGQGFRDVIEETLARGEKMMRAAMPKLPLAVVRPTFVVGDSQTGEIERFDGPYLLVLLVLASPPDFPLALPGSPDAPLHLVPVDHYVRAACAIGRDARAPGRTFHIGDPAPLTVKRVFELVAAAAGRQSPRGFIPANVTKALLRTPGLDRILKSPRAFASALATPVTYSFANTAELLADTDVKCPPLESYIEPLVGYVQQRLRQKRDREAEVDDPLG